MASVVRQGKTYAVRYWYTDEHGKRRLAFESKATEKEAMQRKYQIEKEKAEGTLLIPSAMTVSELLEKWLAFQSAKHHWAPSTYESTLGMIQNLICPYIGSLQVQQVRPLHIEKLYATLSRTPCYQYQHGVKQELKPKQQQRLLSGSTLHEVHVLLRCVFSYAVEWGLILRSPVPRDAPKKTTGERAIWNEAEMTAALATIEDPLLHLAVHLAIVGSLRVGELLGITPADLVFDAANGRGTVSINKTLQRVSKKALDNTDPRLILRRFPDKREFSNSALILKGPKNKNSVRRIYMTGPLREELKQWLARVETQEKEAGEKYDNSGLLFRLPNGQAVEQTLVRKWFERWEGEHPEFGKIVFHALRHSSATYQLLISDGDVKSVQGNTGHASADMLVNTYAHIQDAPRLALSRKFESSFYRDRNAEPTAQALTGEALLTAIRSADDETKRELARALFA